jgi:hypothetical protein
MMPTGEVEKSIWLRENFPANKSSKSRRKTICGLGVNDADYVVNPKILGVRHPCRAYSTWRNMIERCASQKYKDNHPAYRDAIVCDSWISFMSFRDWYLANYVEGYDIDKDLLSCGGKIYSPETCIFIPKWLNLFIAIGCGEKNLPTGVHFDVSRGSYKASAKNGNKTTNLGRYTSANAASEAYINFKLATALQRKDEIDAIATGLYDCVVSYIKEKAR